ncbi:hypothetical protein DAPPUDRAFT_54916 [Daphnia pulex]|uniref:GATOR complex protein NPRL3 n=1 Tax=Daphnia pulex TaxID=6669 RepID=E9GUW8_DAPPU|nr:hypothetical protein DAPPUDRAFT_54916 [Daphnia pulex]|eukprot:EFX76720.1 hypothetical protein DAPPUDRAFT_54916 [Daphnia pulex]
MDVNPLAVILVENGSKGDRLLFRYPYDTQATPNFAKRTRAKQLQTPYPQISAEDMQKTSAAYSSTISGSVHSFPSKVLSNLFAVKSELCGKKFEIKINDIRFVGHPLLVYHQGEGKSAGSSQESILSFNVVFALKASASHAVVDCYHEVSKRIAAALWHEERRVAYLSEEAKVMTSTQDDISSELPDDPLDVPYHLILQRSQLARDLRRVYEDLQISGKIHLRINRWILISCCLPQKIYHLLDPGLIIEPADIHACMEALRPYHAILLLGDKEKIINNLPLDSSPALKRLINLANPLKSLQTLAADADLTLSHVFQLVGHMLYFGHATIIYPLCDSNVYVLAGSANTSPQSKLADVFSEMFNSACLIQIMSEFSVPVSLSQRRNPLATPEQESEEIKIIIWMLQHHLLIQLHTYVHIVTRVTFASRQSTPDDLNAGSSLTRMPSDSDMASVISDEALSSPPSHKSISSKAPLCKYFRGKHHLEEIMYLENVRRSDLLHLIDKFRTILITFEHEDSACSVFYKNSTT